MSPVAEQETPVAETTPETPTPEQETPATKAKKKKASPKNQTTAKVKASKKKTAAQPDREIVYPDIKVKLFHSPQSKPMTADNARKYLGWTELGEDTSTAMIADHHGKAVWCSQNFANRPIDKGNLEKIKNDILHGNWHFNGESMSIGKTGSTLNCQHRMIALILAAQAYAAEPDKYPALDAEPTIETILVTGVDEDQATINTYDTGKTRTVADAIYQSHYFGNRDPSFRRKACRFADYALRLLWARTGQPMKGKKTTADYMFFLERHSSIIPMVEHVMEENSDNKLSEIMSLGYLSAMAYLMGVSNSHRENKEGTGYIQVANPDESCLDFKLWDTAMTFITHLAQGHESVNYISRFLKQEDAFVGRYPTFQEKTVVLVKGWLAHLESEKITPKMFKPAYHTDDVGYRYIAENPSVGGIDHGDPKYVDPAPQ